MTWSRAWIPYGRYWSSPFSRWQGGLAGQHSLKLAAQVGAAAFAGFSSLLGFLIVFRTSQSYSRYWDGCLRP